MTRRCLICANINPCRLHSADDQEQELARNDREIAKIKSAAKRVEMSEFVSAPPPKLPTSDEWFKLYQTAANARLLAEKAEREARQCWVNSLRREQLNKEGNDYAN